MHPVIQVLQLPQAPPITSRALRALRASPLDASRSIARHAIVALYEELALPHKPGLVSFESSGSHGDMNAGTFIRSLFALRHYFAAIAEQGARGAGFAPLQALGIQAESAMLRATAGVNTHRGAIFLLGLLCASAGALHAKCLPRSPEGLQSHLLRNWGEALRVRAQTARVSNGQLVAQRLGLRSAGKEAALGFPVLFQHTWPALLQAKSQGLSPPLARLQALMCSISALQDTNLAHRGGLAGLSWAQRQARQFLAEGGAAHPEALQRAQRLHAAFVRRRLSPGGSADMLAAACWLERWSNAA